MAWKVLDFAAPFEVFGVARTEGGQFAFEAGAERNPIACQWLSLAGRPARRVPASRGITVGWLLHRERLGALYQWFHGIGARPRMRSGLVGSPARVRKRRATVWRLQRTLHPIRDQWI